MDIVSPNRFYVYLYRRNGLPFYVGKGCGDRMNQHFACARKHQTCKHLTCRVIRKEWREGGEITVEKVCEDVPEGAAFRVERLMITIGIVNNWPLVNQTIGGEGVSGYIRDEEWRKRRSALVKQKFEEGKYAHLKTVNKGRAHTPEVEQRRSSHIKERWTTDTDLLTQQRERTRLLWQDSAYREKRQATISSSEYKAGQRSRKRKSKRKTNPTTHYGFSLPYQFVDPLGAIHRDVYNLRAFCRQYGLHASKMCLVAQEKCAMHKGWTKYKPNLDYPL